jgi:hypothetical protein
MMRQAIGYFLLSAVLNEAGRRIESRQTNKFIRGAEVMTNYFVFGEKPPSLLVSSQSGWAWIPLLDIADGKHLPKPMVLMENVAQDLATRSGVEILTLEVTEENWANVQNREWFRQMHQQISGETPTQESSPAIPTRQQLTEEAIAQYDYLVRKGLDPVESCHTALGKMLHKYSLTEEDVNLLTDAVWDHHDRVTGKPRQDDRMANPKQKKSIDLPKTKNLLTVDLSEAQSLADQIGQEVNVWDDRGKFVQAVAPAGRIR